MHQLQCPISALDPGKSLKRTEKNIYIYIMFIYIAWEKRNIYIYENILNIYFFSVSSSLIEFETFFRGVLHSNPMDYAWGANGLDAIITQVSLRNVVRIYSFHTTGCILHLWFYFSLLYH